MFTLKEERSVMTKMENHRITKRFLRIDFHSSFSPSQSITLVRGTSSEGYDPYLNCLTLFNILHS